VNNAGIIRVSTLTQIELSDWNLIQRVNATSVLLGIKAVAPTMIRRGGGSIINIASTAAHRGAEGYGAYSASKAAILALTRAAALELAPHGIRVNSIRPGGVDTPMNRDEPAGSTSSGAPLGRRDLPARRVSGLRRRLLRDRLRLPRRWRRDDPMTTTSVADGVRRLVAAQPLHRYGGPLHGQYGHDARSPTDNPALRADSIRAIRFRRTDSWVGGVARVPAAQVRSKDECDCGRDDSCRTGHCRPND
jgi:NAD(P)-dependent dehydrogenase (short-subunit alcohol dehydrogenase family)